MFKAKLELLKTEIIKKKVLGEVVVYVYVIKSQKRGLPHAHFLLLMKPGSKSLNPESL